ncbi:MAG: rubrerythrin family protein [Halobacteriales archaeon]|nr:rubrerythrin family protein [Halobacteriales archaeon]
MNAEEFTATVRADNDTALSRLGSSKSLYADTAGEMDPETVLRAAAAAERTASETFEEWADDDAAGEFFGTVADEEHDHYEQVLAELDADAVESDVTEMHEELRARTDPVERLGAFVGRALVAEKSKEQVTGFFVGQADPQTASTFRALGDDLDGQLARATDHLAALCASDDDWQRALDAAGETIQTAYETYTDQLEEMGVNPKPVC